MNPKRLALELYVFFGLLVLPWAVQAQERGRTDSPEGSEYGKGGYRPAGSGTRFSLEANWGAAIESNGEGFPTDGTPLFVGGTASYWNTDWFLIDLSGAYIFTSKKGEILVGPRFRSMGYPISFSFAAKAGPIFIPNLGTRFGVSPQVGADVFMESRLILGLSYAPDIALGSGASGGVTHRISLNIGYRF
jgi:hypothetical protein